LKENDGERKINMTNTKQLLPDNINQWLTENYGWLHNIEVEGDMFEIVQRIIAEALAVGVSPTTLWNGTRST